MDKLIMKGNSVEDATNAALEVLKAKKEDVEIRVIREGKGGVLGIFGAEQAEVEVWPKASPSSFAQEFLQGILDRMKFMALASVTKEEIQGIEMNIRGEDMGRIIGKEGATLDALQIMVGIAASRRMARRVRVVVDAEGYREKQNKKTERLATEKAAEVKSTGKEIMLPPLSARERRVAHMVLQDDPKVKTYSEGIGSERRLIIAPK